MLITYKFIIIYCKARQRVMYTIQIYLVVISIQREISVILVVKVLAMKRIIVD